jgi:uncharacterized membrane protein YfcA
MYELILLVTSMVAGFLGAILGIGGGMILVPVLTLVFHVDIRYAVAASLISIIATSSGAAAGLLRDHFTNLRLAVLLEVATVTGAITGFLVSSFISPQSLYFLFGGFLLFSAVMMVRKKGDSISHINHPWAEKLRLHSSFPAQNGTLTYYAVEKIPFGLFVMYIAGILSALLGIGSGILKVLAMDGAMKLPMKVSSATSNFMIGVTASASAGAYLFRGDIRPEIAGPVSVGIIIGSWFGAKSLVAIPSQAIRKIFVVLLTIVSIQMIIKAFQ